MNFLRIKWENIIALGTFFIVTYYNTKIFMEQGFDFGVFGCELILNAMMIYVIIYIFGNIRKEFLKK